MITTIVIVFYCLFAVLAWRNFLLALSVLVFALPSYLIRFSIGPLPTTLLEGMILLIVVIWGIKKLIAQELPVTRYPLPVTTALLIPLSLFFLGSIVSIFSAPDTTAALGLWRAYILEPLLFFTVFLNVATKNPLLRGEGEGEVRFLDAIIIALAASACVLSAFAIIQYFTGWAIPHPWNDVSDRRVTSIFPYPNALGLYLAPIVILLIGWVLEQKEKSAFVFLCLCASVTSVVAILAAKSHGAIASVFVGLLVISITSKRLRMILVAFVLLAAVAIGSFAPWRTYVVDRVTFRSPSGKVRIAQYKDTMRMMADHWMLGGGLAGYQKTVAPYHTRKAYEIYFYPHNIFLAIWTELGLLGLLSFLWLLATVFVTALKKIKLHPTPYALLPATAALAALITLLVHGLVDVPFFKNDLAILFWLIVGLILTQTTPMPRDVGLQN